MADSLIRLIQAQQIVIGIVIEEFAVTAPLHGDGELLMRLVVGVTGAQQVQHELAAELAFRRLPQCMLNVVHQRRVFHRQ